MYFARVIAFNVATRSIFVDASYNFRSGDEDNRWANVLRCKTVLTYFNLLLDERSVERYTQLDGCYLDKLVGNMFR